MWQGKEKEKCARKVKWLKRSTKLVEKEAESAENRRTAHTVDAKDSNEKQSKVPRKLRTRKRKEEQKDIVVTGEGHNQAPGRIRRGEERGLSRRSRSRGRQGFQRKPKRKNRKIPPKSITSVCGFQKRSFLSLANSSPPWNSGLCRVILVWFGLHENNTLKRMTYLSDAHLPAGQQEVLHVPPALGRIQLGLERINQLLLIRRFKTDSSSYHSRRGHVYGRHGPGPDMVCDVA